MIFVAAPHANMLVDPLVVICTCPRQVRFLTAAVTMKQKIAGFFIRLVRGISVERAHDNATKGIGMVTYDDKDPSQLTLRGVSTKFTEQIADVENLSILISRGGDDFNLAISKVVDNTTLQLQRPLDDSLRALLIKQGSLCFRIGKKLDQGAVYSTVFEGLRKGQCIGIFPEGGSHDRAEMLP